MEGVKRHLQVLLLVLHFPQGFRTNPPADQGKASRLHGGVASRHAAPSPASYDGAQRGEHSFLSLLENGL